MKIRLNELEETCKINLIILNLFYFYIFSQNFRELNKTFSHLFIFPLLTNPQKLVAELHM